MAPPRAALLLVASLLLAGCSLPVRESSSEDAADRSEYDGSGLGLALHLENRAPEPFDVTVVVRTSDGDEVARLEQTIEGNGTAEKWWSLSQGAYVLDMRYQWRSGARTATGDDDASVEVGSCPELARVGWRFIRVDQTVGSAFTGKSCVGANGESA